jgi:endonuclease/exonuclease/phosphatase family metal-dependent hydrolase
MVQRVAEVIFVCLLLAGVTQAGINRSPEPGEKLISHPSTTPAKILSLRIASYNTQYGTQRANILKNIQSVNPDIVLLQETPLENVKSFARTLGMSYQFGPYNPKVKIGLGILAIGKITPVKLLTMTGERNFALAARVCIGDREILVVSTHFKSLPRPLVTGLIKVMGPHKAQADMIVDLVKQTKLPTIVGGDLNTLALTPAFITLSLSMRDTAEAAGTSSQPSIFINGAGYRIDHLLVRGPWKTLASKVSPLPGSDHRLIWAQLELRK